MSTLTPCAVSSIDKPVDVVILLGSHWSDLERVPTRWHQVIRRWAQWPDVASLHVVDFPRLRPGPARLDEQPSWLTGVTSWRCRVPVLRRHRLLDAVGWPAAARALLEVLPSPFVSRPVVIASTPVWGPVLPALQHRARVGFDAYDDWRALPAVQSIARRIAAGYVSARVADSVTFGSPQLAARLSADVRLQGTVVRNGVAGQAFASPGSAPENLPAEPFAVYVGMVQERVDLDLLIATTAAMPTVVAGPVDAAIRPRLESAGVICLGPVPPVQVPGLLHRAAVGLVPHVVDALTLSMDPLKVYEYRAAGLPVVSTPVAGSDLEGVHVVGQRDNWPVAVRAAAANGRRKPTSLRDWDEVATELFRTHVGIQTLAVSHER